MKNRLLIFALIVSLSSCMSTQKYMVSNVHDLVRFNENSFVYSLPHTRFAVQVTAVREYTVPGPYQDYADQFLGIKGVPQVSQTYWTLVNVDFKAFQEPDPDYYYSIHSSHAGELPKVLNEMSEYGLVVDADAQLSLINSVQQSAELPEPIHFTDLSVKRFYESSNGERKTSKKSTKVPTDMPVIRQEDAAKSIRGKAEQAADFIIKIRKRRFKLLAGQYDVFPEGQALDISVKELNQLEEEYLALFIGKTYTDTIQQTYYYTPDVGNEMERNVFCRFSEETGFHDPDVPDGTPFVLDIQNLDNTAALKQVQLPSPGPLFENQILYRVPDKAHVRVLYGSKTVVSAEVKVYQYGAFVPFSIGE